MKCPSCGQSATSLLGFSFSMRGVSFLQRIKGLRKCKNCGTLLRIVGFKPTFWIYFGLLFALFFAFWMLLPRIISNVGYKFPLEIWIVWLLLVVFGATYILPKNARLEKAS
jgi:hypothetical protein